jgi:hypothetical protein
MIIYHIYKMYNITPVCVTMYLRYAMIVKYSFHSLILYEIFIGRDVQYLYQFILEGKNLGIIIV